MPETTSTPTRATDTSAPRLPSAVTSLRWEWTLANGGRVAAELDATDSRELVLVGSRVVSSAPRGERVDGHTAIVEPVGTLGAREPITVTVTFEPRQAICVLRVDGFEVAPTLWPTRRRPAVAPAPAPRPRWVPAAVAIAAALGIVYLVGAARTRTPAGPAPLDAVHRSPSGLFVARHPKAMTARVPTLPSPLAGVVLDDAAAKETVFVVALSLTARELEGGAARDPWALQRRLQTEALVSVGYAARSYGETTRSDDTCLGARGAVVVGRLERPDGSRAKTWSCALTVGDRGYLVGYVAPETLADVTPLRRVVDAVEPTSLGALGPP